MLVGRHTRCYCRVAHGAQHRQRAPNPTRSAFNTVLYYLIAGLHTDIILTAGIDAEIQELQDLFAECTMKDAKHVQSLDAVLKRLETQVYGFDAKASLEGVDVETAKKC